MDEKLRLAMKAGLMDAYRHKRLDDGRCAFCASTKGPFSLHVAEFAQSSEAPLVDGFIRMSQSHGRLRGSIPICIECAPSCKKCKLPIVTRWTVAMVAELRRRHPALSINAGNGFCRHIHFGSLFRALFKSVRIAESTVTSQSPAVIVDAITNLVRQRTADIADGKHPETLLIPHIRIKLEIIIAAYADDLAAAMARIDKNALQPSDIERETQRMTREVEEISYELRRIPSRQIELQFEHMARNRHDMKQFEAQVRAISKSKYSAVPPLDLN